MEVAGLLSKYAVMVSIGSTCVRLMPLAHELIFNLLRKRMDRYVPIAEKMRSDPASYIPPLLHILNRNRLTDEHVKTIEHLLLL